MIDQIKRGIRSEFISFGRILMIVEIKLIEAKIDETPAKCNEKIAKSTCFPECPRVLAKGGYTVHPVPTPFSVIDEDSNKIRDGGRSQNLMLFIRGNAMSGLFNINGINQLPNPPIIIGITRKKIIKNACAVTKVLYSWSESNRCPGCVSSIRIIILIEVPTKPDQIPKIKYKVPMSLWLVE